MTNKIMKHFLSFSAAAFACAVVLTGNPVPAEGLLSSNEQDCENIIIDTSLCGIDNESGIAPQSDRSGLPDKKESIDF